jgi:hypothetical protein
MDELLHFVARKHVQEERPGWEYDVIGESHWNQIWDQNPFLNSPVQSLESNLVEDTRKYTTTRDSIML